MRGSGLFLAMLVISSGVAPVWGQAKTATTTPNKTNNTPQVKTTATTTNKTNTATPAPPPVEAKPKRPRPYAPDEEPYNADQSKANESEDQLSIGNIGNIKDVGAFLDQTLAQVCSSAVSGGQGPKSINNPFQYLILVACINGTRMATELVNKLVQGGSNQTRENVAQESRVVSNTSATNAIVRSDSYLSPFPSNTANNNRNENPSGNIPVASWNPTNRDNLSPNLPPSSPSALEPQPQAPQVGSRGYLVSDNKIEMDRSTYTALLARNEEVHRLASQMVYQILSKQGQDLSHKQLQAMQEVLKNGQAIQEMARGYEKATQQLVMVGVKSIDSLGQQMQAEEGKLSSKTGEIQSKQSTQEVLKAISELMKDIGLSTQKAIIGTGSGIASSLSGLTKVAGSVEATVASINNTNNILATMNENQIKSLELAATAISLQQQQMKMQETELLEKYRNNLTGKNTIPLGSIIGVSNLDEPNPSNPSDQPNKPTPGAGQVPKLSGGQI